MHSGDFTPRQKQIGRLMLEGRSCREIARILELSQGVVRKYVHSILERKSITELANARARKKGYSNSFQWQAARCGMTVADYNNATARLAGYKNQCHRVDVWRARTKSSGGGTSPNQERFEKRIKKFEPSYFDSIEDHRNGHLPMEDVEILRNALAPLSPSLANTIYQRYYKGKTLQEIADEEGLTREAIRHREELALERMQQYFASIPFYREPPSEGELLCTYLLKKAGLPAPEIRKTINELFHERLPVRTTQNIRDRFNNPIYFSHLKKIRDKYLTHKSYKAARTRVA